MSSTVPGTEYWPISVPKLPAPITYPAHVSPSSTDSQRVYDLEQEVKRLRKELDELKARVAK